MTHDPLWSFAVIADTHVEADPGAPSNLRLQEVVTALTRAKPEMVLHLGDIIHPIPDAPGAPAARDRADDILSALPCPIYVVPGNHDIGDKPMAGMPTASVRADWRQDWIDRHGPDFRWFDHNDVRFVLANSPKLNRPGEDDSDLTALLDEVSALPNRKPIVLVTHYPLFLENEDEPSHYDNVGNPARSQLIEFCKKMDARAVFTGHVHTYLHRHIGNTRCYGAPSVAFVRRDFSEMAQVAPLAEFGREDPAKTGFFWVDVTNDGMQVRVITTEDMADFSKGTLPGDTGPDARLPIGVTLRHDWARVIELPVNPPVAPFLRRQFRDDDTFRALIASGIGALRLPAADLMDAARRQRIREAKDLGFQINGFALGAPDSALTQILTDHGALLDALELAAPIDAFSTLLPDAADLCRRHHMTLWAGPLLTPGKTDPKATHKVRYGFDSPDAADTDATVQILKDLDMPAGLIFSMPMSGFGKTEAEALDGLATSTGITPVVLLDRLAPDTVALHDDKVLPQRVAAMLALAREYPKLRLILDTLMEFDRSYHARAGLVDRRMALTAAGKVLRDAHRIQRKFPNT